MRGSMSACYWCSGPSHDVNSVETLDFKLAHPLCVIHEIALQPFKADFQPVRLACCWQSAFALCIDCGRIGAMILQCLILQCVVLHCGGKRWTHPPSPPPLPACYSMPSCAGKTTTPRPSKQGHSSKGEAFWQGRLDKITSALQRQ